MLAIRWEFPFLRFSVKVDIIALAGPRRIVQHRRMKVETYVHLDTIVNLVQPPPYSIRVRVVRTIRFLFEPQSLTVCLALGATIALSLVFHPLLVFVKLATIAPLESMLRLQRNRMAILELDFLVLSEIIVQKVQLSQFPARLELTLQQPV
jgi:hypothetical protein